MSGRLVNPILTEALLAVDKLRSGALYYPGPGFSFRTAFLPFPKFMFPPLGAEKELYDWVCWPGPGIDSFNCLSVPHKSYLLVVPIFP